MELHWAPTTLGNVISTRFILLIKPWINVHETIRLHGRLKKLNFANCCDYGNKCFEPPKKGRKKKNEVLIEMNIYIFLETFLKS
jgi:hypothetical protein